MKFFLFSFFIAGIYLTSSAQLVYKDVAGIFYNRCTPCHHTNGGAPFSLMSYSQTYPWVASIQADINSGKMPPWPPDTAYTRFLHERIITASEKSAILSWINSGALKGDTTLVPTPPVYTNKYKLYGTPDLILKVPAFPSNGGATDAYNCFSIPTGLTQDRYVRAFEIVPNRPSMVHHVVVKVDSTGTIASNTSGSCFSQPGQYDLDVYVPGAAPTVFPGKPPLKCGIRIKAGAKVNLQIHYPPGTAGLIDSTEMRIFLYPVNATGIRPVYVSTPLQNWSLFIPANTIPSFSAQYPASGGLPIALSVFGAGPHGHLVSKTMLNYADNGSNTIPLIRINKWDFEWQGFYTFRKLVKIPAGYTLRTTHSFDNTTANPNNPNSPPALVTAGEGTKDEMLFDSFQYLIYQPGDELIDIGNLISNDSLLNTSVKDEPPINLQSLAYPNPFSDNVRIGYELTVSAETFVSVYNIFGSEIKKLSNQYNSAGVHSVSWDGKNDEGYRVPAGIYFYTIRTGKSATSGKIVFMPK